MTILGRESECELRLLAKDAFSFIVPANSHGGTASCYCTIHTEYGSKSNEVALENPYFIAGVIADHIVQRVPQDNYSWIHTQKELILINQGKLLLWHEILYVCMCLSIHMYT